MPLSLTSRPRVVLFGDSLTQRGFEEQGWASALCDYYTRRADVLNRGYGGWNSRWARFVAADLLAPAAPRDGAKPHHVVAVWFGANDAAAPTERAHVPLAEYGQNLDAIVALAQRSATHVVVLTPPPVHGPTRLAFQRAAYGAGASGRLERSTELAGQYAREAARVAAERGVAALDVHGAMLALGEDAWPALVGAGVDGGDGLHLAPAGQRFVARALIGALDELGAGPDALAQELPLGREIDPAAFGDSIRAHQRRADAAAVARAGAGGASAARPGVAWRFVVDAALSNGVSFALGVTFVLLTRCLRAPGSRARGRGAPAKS